MKGREGGALVGQQERKKPRGSNRLCQLWPATNKIIAVQMLQMHKSDGYGQCILHTGVVLLLIVPINYPIVGISYNTASSQTRQMSSQQIQNAHSLCSHI